MSDLTYYVSGPMRGLPKYNFPAFDHASEWLRSHGIEAINPADHDRELEPDIEHKPHYLHGDASLNVSGPKFDELIRWDLDQIARADCTGIVLLAGWETSSGAAIELAKAQELGKEVWELKRDGEKYAWFNFVPKESIADRTTSELLPGDIIPGVGTVVKVTAMHMIDVGDRWVDGSGEHPWRKVRRPARALHHRDPEPVYAAIRDGERQEALEAQARSFAKLADTQARRIAAMLDPITGEPDVAGLYTDARLTVQPEPYAARQAAAAKINAQLLDLGHGFVTKDSGKRVAFDSGMVRDTDDGKPRYDLIPLAPLRRLAELYARGAIKYGDRNWQKANSPEELARFKASAFRHFVSWLNGEVDEDHGIAVVWNIFAAEWLAGELAKRPDPLDGLDGMELAKAKARERIYGGIANGETQH